MKHILCLLATGVLSLGAGAQNLFSDFDTPPQKAKPQVWWHWMDGNVTKEGMLKDLEWMKRSGIGGLHQFDAGGVNMPQAAPKRLEYMSEEWKEAFRYALKVADSLGLDVTIASAPGWSSTGGRWVKPQDAVKKLEFRSLDVESDGHIKVQLPDLYRVVGPYQDFFVGNDRIEVKPFGEDICTLAVSRSDDDLSLAEMGAETSLQGDSLITIDLKKERTIKAFTLCSYAMGERPRSGEPVFRNFLEYSKDGLEWKTACGIMPSAVPYMTEDIEPCTARYFRVKGQKIKSLELFTVSKINHSEEQGGFSIVRDFAAFTTPDAVTNTKVLNLSGCVLADGTLDCELPAGRWRIYRFGWSITGKVNHPASPEATGLEVDKLDPQAWKDYFRTYLDMYLEASGGLFGDKGVKYLLTDSYEAGSFTWTAKLPQEFLSRRGYDMLPWLPVLAGEILESSSRSEQFLRDFRRTLGELFCENYDRINGIMKEYRLQGRYCETHEGGRAYTGDGMDPRISSTVPMAAIWMEDTPAGSPIWAAITDIREAASVAHIYGQNIVAGESFTVCGDEGHAYTYCPENMKYVADVALSAGLNRFVIHESASQPDDKYLPGLQLFRYGQWLHRNETWADNANVFLDYLSRSCSLLQQGRDVSDILVYYGEGSNVTALYGGDSPEGQPAVPQGFNYDFANATVLTSGVEPAGGRLVSKAGASYKVLWLDKNCSVMSVKVLQRIKSFADAGIIICGNQPTVCDGENSELFSALVSDIWHSSRKNVFTDIVSATASLSEDFAAAGNIRYTHRCLSDGSQIYWVRNFGKSATVPMSFRDGGSRAWLLNAETGSACALDYSEVNGRCCVNLPLKDTDAAFVVFSSSVPGSCREVSADKLMQPYNLPGSKIIGTVRGPWLVEFDQKNGGEASIKLDTLCSWTALENPVIRYYSGTAVYTTDFKVNARCGELYLDLGSVKNIAEVYVNGHRAGVLWKAPFRTNDITPYLVKGRNTLTIKVTNLWRNRMIGDVQPGETHPVTAIRRFYKASDSPIPSGLLGPVRIISDAV